MQWLIAWPLATGNCYAVLRFSCGEFSWDPGIWALLYFSEIFAQATAHGGIIVEASGYCYNHYMVGLFDQVIFRHDYSMNLLQVHPYHINEDHRYHHHGNIKESHVPWDPGGSTLARLGDKPYFMEGGLSATSSIPTMGQVWPAIYWTWARSEVKEMTPLQIEGERQGMGRLETEGLRPGRGVVAVLLPL
jgi:hypothetical protein